MIAPALIDSMQAASGCVFTAFRTVLIFSEPHSPIRSAAGVAVPIASFISPCTCVLATSPTSLANPRTSFCRASKSARSEFSRLCMPVDAFTVFVLRLRRVAVAMIVSAIGIGLRGVNVRRGKPVPSRGFAAQRMEEQRLADGCLYGFRQERLGDEIGRLRTFAGQQ